MNKNRKARLLRSASILVLVASLAPATVHAGGVLPSGGTVAAGSARIGAPANGGLTINQTSTHSVINWNSFSVGQPNSVTFAQPDASSATLNRVVGGTNSTIAGKITANGSVYLVNPNGIQITSTGTVNTGAGFVASTLGISDSDFMAGKSGFTGNGASASVNNAGRIVTGPGGFVALLGGSVSNSGLISAPMGEIGLGSGEQATLDVNGDQFLQVTVPTHARDANGRALVTNSGKLRARGGQVVLTAATVKEAVRDAINMPGSISANSVSGRNGSIILGGGAGGNVAVSGRIRSRAGRVAISGANVALNRARISVGSRRGRGGTVTATASGAVSLTSTKINASGKTGGGVVLIGGDLHGGGTLAQAQSVAFDSASVINANAAGAGNGGEVVLWSDGATKANGLITAMGGPNGGDGGAVETSGHTVDFAGVAVNTSASRGAAGSWLIDPTDLTINSGDAATIDSALNLGTSVTLTTTAGTPTETGVSGVGTQSSGNGDINVDSGISWSGTAALTLQAHNNININAAVSLTTGTLSLYAAGNTGGSTAGTTTNLNTGAIVVNAPITISGAGTVNLKANSLSSLTVDGVATTFSPNDLELSFGTGGSINYGATDSGGHLNINSAAYNLLYSVAAIASIDTLGDTLKYALATNVTDGTTYAAALAGAGADNDTSGKVFSGVFEGLGNTITDLQILSSAGNQYLGLFGQSSGVLRDLNLSGGSVSGGTVVDTDSVGALVGMNIGGLVANVTSSTSVSGSGTQAYFINPGAPGDYISAGGGVGGLVGANVAGNVMQSQATGAVTDTYGANANNVGGLVGLNTGNIDINNTGYVGGTGTATILYSSATGQVIGGSDPYVGGLVGSNIGSGADGFYNSSQIVVPQEAGIANIIASWASGNVSGGYAGNSSASGTLGTPGYVAAVMYDLTSAGGLAGGNQDGGGGAGTGLILDSYATGNLSDPGNSGASPGGNYGGLIGYEGTNNGGTAIIKNSYATGAVTGLSGDIIGGAIGGDCASDAGCNSVFGPGAITDVYASNGVAESDPGDGVTAVTTGQLKGGLLPGLSSTVWTVGASGNGNNGFPVVTSNAPIPPTIPLTYSVGDATGTYGMLATLGAVTLSGSPANVAGTISLYNSSDVLVTLSSGLYAGTYAEKVTALTGSAASGYSIASSGNAPGTLIIGTSPLTITADNQNKVYGAALPTLTVSYGGFVNGDTAASLTTAPTVSTTATTASHVSGNPYGITPSGAVDSNYTISYVAGSLTVTQALLTITADSQNKVYGAALPTLTVSYGGLVNGDTAASLTTAPTLTTTAMAASHVSGNPYAITASGAVDSDYSISYMAGSLTVTQAPLTITPDSQNKVYGASLPTLTVSYGGFVNGDTAASLTTAPTLTTTATAASHVSGNPYAITASGAVDTDYAFTYAAGSLTVTQALLTITADSQNKVYGAALPTLTVSYGGFVNGDTAASLTTAPTLTTTATAASHVSGNPYAITPSGAVDTDYAFTYAAGSLTVTQALLTITADSQNKVYGAALPTLTASYGGLVNGDTAASLTTAPTLTTTATAASHVSGNPYAITPSGAVDNDYAFTYVAGTLTVTQAALTITADNQNSTYGAALPTLTASYSGLVNGDTAASLTTAPTLSTIGTSSSNVGGYGITVTGAVDGDYAITYAPGTLTIGQAALTITADNKSSTYGGALPALTASYSGLVNGDTSAIVTTAPTLSTPATSASNAGGYAITASGAVAAGSNYAITYVQGTLTIGQAALTITADDKSSTYGGALPALTASYNGFVNGDTPAIVTTAPTLSTTATSASNVGGYAITASGAVADSNYAITYVPGTLTIGQAALTITPGNQAKTYGTDLALGASAFTASTLYNGDSVSVVTLSSAGSAATAPVGGYDITASNATGAGLSNYVITYAVASDALTVNPAHVIVTAASGTSVYGSVPIDPGFTATGLQNGESASVLTGLSNSFGVTAASNVSSGPYTLSVAGTLSNTNYTIDQRNAGTWAVTPAMLTYVANPVSRLSDTGNPVFTGAVTGFFLSDTQASATTGTLTFSSNASSTAEPGSYAILGSGLVANDNYIFVQAPGNATALTVTPAGATADASLVTPSSVVNQGPWFVFDTFGPGFYTPFDLQINLNTPNPPEANKFYPCFATGLGAPAACSFF